MTDRKQHRRGRLDSFPIRLRMGRGGASFIAGTMFVGMAAIDADNNILLLLFGLLLGAVLLGLGSGWRTLRRISVTRLAPEIVVAGQPFQVRYTITNHGIWAAARDLTLQDASTGSGLVAPLEAFVPYLGPGESITVAVSAVALRRGKIMLSNMSLSTGFPFAVFSKSVVHRRASELIVFPSLGRMRGPVGSKPRVAAAAGAETAVSVTRGEDEFYGLREYRHGDNPRRIHWRRSAQAGQLMIREMAKAREAQFWCVLDTCADPRSAAQLDRLEAAISGCATVLCDALETGARVGLICSGESLIVLPPTAGRHRRARFLRELAVRSADLEQDLGGRLARVPWPARWRGPCLLFGAEPSYELRRSAHMLARYIGPTQLYVPGTADFEKLLEVRKFVPAHSTVPPPAAASPATAPRPSVRARP